MQGEADRALVSNVQTCMGLTLEPTISAAGWKSAYGFESEIQS
tara:strand:- start:596 stop:724 length:129 start_codon:yes stop_codon:yes gene_type:complete